MASYHPVIINHRGNHTMPLSASAIGRHIHHINHPTPAHRAEVSPLLAKMYRQRMFIFAGISVFTSMIASIAPTM